MNCEIGYQGCGDGKYHCVEEGGYSTLTEACTNPSCPRSVCGDMTGDCPLDITPLECVLGTDDKVSNDSLKQKFGVLGWILVGIQILKWLAAIVVAVMVLIYAYKSGENKKGGKFGQFAFALFLMPFYMMNLLNTLIKSIPVA